MTTFFLELDSPIAEAAVEALETLADNAEALAVRLPAPWDRLMRVDAPDGRLLTVLRDAAGVRRVVDLDPAHPLVSRAMSTERGTVPCGSRRIGDGHFDVIAGPCSVEHREQLLEAAGHVIAAGATAIRAGAFKPRTSPWDFQGLGHEGLAILAHTGRALGTPIVTEIVDPRDLDAMVPHVDLFQVGARNMQNYALLRALAEQPHPVLLKRGPGATLREWLTAAEYLVAGGNPHVILCERGIRTFEQANRYTLDLAGAVLARQETWLPVIIDPSHATGRPSLIPAMTLAAQAAGLDGAIVEVHPRPDEALSDGDQALTPATFAAMMVRLQRAGSILDRPLPRPVAAPALLAHGTP